MAVDAPFVNQSTPSVAIDQRKGQYDVAGKTLHENQETSSLYRRKEKTGFVTTQRLEGMKRLAAQEGLSLFVRQRRFQ